MSTTESYRKPVVDYIKAMLGDGMIDLELDPIHYDTAIDRAFAKYRQKSSNAVELCIDPGGVSTRRCRDVRQGG